MRSDATSAGPVNLTHGFWRASRDPPASLLDAHVVDPVHLRIHEIHDPLDFSLDHATPPPGTSNPSLIGEPRRSAAPWATALHSRTPAPSSRSARAHPEVAKKLGVDGHNHRGDRHQNRSQRG